MSDAASTVSQETSQGSPVPEVVAETNDLTKVYTDFWGYSKVLALSHLNLQIYRGEIFGLLGPNGSGKTTTTKLLLGLLWPTEGGAKIFGEPPGSIEANRRIGFLPEESYLYRFLNAEETMDFYGQLFGIPRRERKRRAAALIEQVGLASARKRPLKEYSKGMSRRIGLAQALINDPEFLILDEPTTGLDPIGRAEMKDMLVRLRGEGKTILMCSHLLPDVQDVCDRIGILNRGQLKVLGPMEELLRQKELVEIIARNLPEDALTRVRELIASSGELVSVSPPQSTLEDLFLKTVQEKDRDAGTAGAG